MNIVRSTACAATDTTMARWRRTLHGVVALCVLALPLQAVAFTLQFGDEDFIQTPIAGNVQSFRFTVDIDAPLAAGVYENPPLVQIDYRVSGEPIVDSPSGFPAFALSLSISGADFYQAGNELVFEIADTAVLSDGVQAVELVGTTIILRFDAREEGTGRFHPALLELRADGTGQLQNSDNVPDLAEPEGIPLGSEYITDLAFDPGNLTLLISDDAVQPDPEEVESAEVDSSEVDSTDADSADADSTDADSAEDDSADDEEESPGNEESENSETAFSESSGGVTGIAVLLMLMLCLFMRSRLCSIRIFGIRPFINDHRLHLFE